MNSLPRDKQAEAVAALTEGCSIRAIERLTGIHRDTIMRLGVRVGNGCATLHDAMMRGLHVSRIELDEAWSFIAKKQRHLKQSDPADFGALPAPLACTPARNTQNPAKMLATANYPLAQAASISAALRRLSAVK